MITYEDLGVRPVINAWGTVTSVGGSLMPELALAAMAEAGKHYVFVNELQEAAGRYIVDRLGVEAAYISSGASAGMTLAAAACMGGQDPNIRSQLPETTSLKNEIIVFRDMRTKYDQAFRVAGANLVEIDWPQGADDWGLETAITEETAAVAYILEHAHPGGMPLDRIIQIAHARSVPVIVDAAAELPPVENLWRFSQLGIDLTIFSGGKDICGPQSTGLIVGRKELIQSCEFHACPNHSIGRGMKVGKEEIMAFVNALDLYLQQDFDREMAIWENQISHIVDSLSAVEGVSAKRVFPGETGIQPIHIPRAYINWTTAVTDRSADEIRDALVDDEPRVIVGVIENDLVVNPQMLKRGQEQIVAESIKRVLGQSRS
jgi:L-seryl-tRNA(Ser) seleniumtransferase